MRRGRRNRRLKAVISGVVVLAAVSAGGWWLWGRDATARAHASDAQTDAPTPHDLAMAVPDPSTESPSRAGNPDRYPAETDLPARPQPEEPPLAEAPRAEVPRDVDLADQVRPGGLSPAAESDEILEPRGGGATEGPDGLASPASGPAGTPSGSDSFSLPALPQAAPQAAPASPVPAASASRSANPAVQEALKRYQAGQRIEARRELNRLLHSPLPEADKEEIRAHLARIASETIFSRSRVEGDPLVDTYTVQRGDRLIHVARRYDIPHETIMLVNGIRDPARIAEGMKLAVPRGPFHARIYKSRFRLDLYLQDLYVRSFPVGLGVDSGTPTGTWRVKNRQPNPTYYPPPSAPDRRVIPPNDPNNPLGEYWIGLEGVEGEALGKEGYGIHGTIEPETIGRNASLGCVRMREEDVALLFRVLQVGKSTVTIYP